LLNFSIRFIKTTIETFILLAGWLKN